MIYLVYVLWIVANKIVVKWSTPVSLLGVWFAVFVQPHCGHFQPGLTPVCAPIKSSSRGLSFNGSGHISRISWEIRHRYSSHLRLRQTFRYPVPAVSAIRAAVNSAARSTALEMVRFSDMIPHRREQVLRMLRVDG